LGPQGGEASRGTAKRATGIRRKDGDRVGGPESEELLPNAIRRGLC